MSVGLSNSGSVHIHAPVDADGLPGHEVAVIGGEKNYRPDEILRHLVALEAAGVQPESLRGYLDAFKYGMPPHGGFAIGLERWVAQLIGAQNIRETTLFPRDLHRLIP